MKVDLISVVIPVYNGEKYIERCLNSILKQSYTNLQIIVVNDGSNDSTEEILGKIGNKDDRIAIVNKSNGGVSSARNEGLQYAKGKYIYFMDCDDYVESTIIEKLYNCIIKENIGLSLCGFLNTYEQKITMGFECGKSEGKLCKRDYLIWMSEYLYSVFFGALWNKLYILDVVKKNKIQFNENVSYGEDFIFNLKYLEYIQSVYILPEQLYYYYHGNNASLTKEKNQLYLWEMAKIRYSFCIEQYSKMKMYEDCKRNIFTAVANELIGPTYSIINSNKKVKQKVMDLETIYSAPLSQQAIKFTDKSTMVHKIAGISIRLHSFKLFYILMKLWVPIQMVKVAGHLKTD